MRFDLQWNIWQRKCMVLESRYCQIAWTGTVSARAKLQNGYFWSSAVSSSDMFGHTLRERVSTPPIKNQFPLPFTVKAGGQTGPFSCIKHRDAYAPAKAFV